MSAFVSINSLLILTPFISFKENVKSEIDDDHVLVEEEIIDKIILTLEERGYILSDEALEAITRNYKLQSKTSYNKYVDLEDDFIISLYESIYEKETVTKHIYNFYN